MPVVTQVRRYPVKSCRGEDLTQGTVEPWGLAGDRRFMLVDDAGQVVTARVHPRLVLVTPEIDGACLRLHTPGHPGIEVAIPAIDPELVPVVVGRSKLDAALLDPTVHEWFSRLIGTSVRLVYLDDPTRRHPNPQYSRSTDLVSLADAYPVLLTSEESLRQVNTWAGLTLPMTRFRPNVVVQGAPSFAEDGWRRVRIGTVEFRVAKSSDRCVFTQIDPETAQKGKEPIFTLARHRRYDGKVWFGVNLIPDGPGTIAPGDPVVVLDAVDTTEPLR